MKLTRKGTVAVAALLFLGLTGFKFVASREKSTENVLKAPPPPERRPTALPVQLALPDPRVEEMQREVDDLKNKVREMSAHDRGTAPSPTESQAPRTAEPT